MADVKVSESVGSVLDWMVMVARDGASVTLDEDLWIVHDGIADMPLDAYTPSTDWSQGGPIIEREDINLRSHMGTDREQSAFLWRNHAPAFRMRGATKLIAAMRCYVASKLGDIVSVPDNLKGE